MSQRQLILLPDWKSFDRVERAVLRKVRRAREEMGSAVNARTEETAVLAERFWPSASGESRDGVHAVRGRWEGDRFVCGVGVKSTPNGQEVRAERGDFRPHTSEAEHDHSGPCSTGLEGGWQDEYELSNPRAIRGLHTNPSARSQPLGTAILQILGRVIEPIQAKSFQRGAKNMYRVVRTHGTTLRESLIRALKRGLAVVLLAVVAASAWSAGKPSGWLPLTSADAELAPGDSLVAVFDLGKGQDYPGLGTLLAVVDSSYNGGADFSLVGYCWTGKTGSTARFGEWLPDSSSFSWFLPSGDAITVAGCWSVQVPYISGDHLTMVLKNESAATDSLILRGLATWEDSSAVCGPSYFWVKD